MIDYKYFDLFQKQSIKKEIVIKTENEDILITNSELFQQQFELEESLCSESELRFGCCEASCIKFKVANVFTPLKDKQINVSVILDGNSNFPFQIGKYKVYSDVPSGDRNYRNITAYDSMCDIINFDFATWYKDLVFPLTIKQFRDSFFDYIGIKQKNASLVNDSVYIEKTIDTDKLSGKDVITAICELNGCFGHIGRNGFFEYITLKQKAEGLFPKNNLYPSNALYPADKKSTTISKNRYTSCEYEDFVCKEITKIQIRQEENDIGCIYGDGDNCYIIQDNFLVYGKGEDELRSILEKLMTVIKDISYRPYSCSCVGNYCFEVGDAIRLNTKKEIINSYILKRKINGIQALKDSFSAGGEYERKENVNGVNEKINSLKGKTNILTRTVEETRNEVKDVEKGLKAEIVQTAEAITAEVTRAKDSEEKLSSSIQQTAESIETKVTKGDISSEISQEPGDITIKANRITIQSDKFTLNKDGSITCTDAKIVGGDIQLISTETSPKFKIYDSEENETVILQSPVCFFKHKSGRGVSIAQNIGSISCYGDGMESPPTAIIGAANSFRRGINVSGVGRFNNEVEIKEKLTVKEDITIQDEWYNGWTVTECLKDLYEKVNALSS